MPVATGQAGSATRSIFARYHRATKASIVCAGVALVSAGFYLWARTAVTVQPLALPSQLVGIPLVRLSDPVIEESGQGAMPAIDSGYPGLVAVATAGPTHIRLELPSIPSPSGLAEVNDASITSPPDLHARVRPREYSVRWPEQIVVEQKRPIGSPVVDVPIQWRYPASGPRGPARPVVDLDIELESPRDCAREVALELSGKVTYAREIPNSDPSTKTLVQGELIPVKGYFEPASIQSSGSFSFFVHCAADVSLRTAYREWDYATSAAEHFRSRMRDVALLTGGLAIVAGGLAALIIGMMFLDRGLGQSRADGSN
jgi:hypothetical protein